MDPITQQTALASAGGKKDPVYVDDVFSTFLYDGNSSTQTITNGIDLSGEGGMLWIKARNAAQGHYLFDTERGPHNALFPDAADAEYVHTTNFLTAFNSDGYSLSTAPNYNGYTYCSWSFRKAPGFFDIVQYTGDGSDNRTISHNLGSVPGCIIIKKLGGISNWYVYHRSLGANLMLRLDTDTASQDGSLTFPSVPTSSTFEISRNANSDQSGNTYVAYVFAHDEPVFGTDENESIIKCDSYTGTGSELDINVGFEPQYVLVKNRSTANRDWSVYDNMRGAFHGVNNSNRLRPNDTSSEGLSNLSFTSTGFKLADASSETNTSGNSYIYMAIRRPNKPPSAGTEVFALNTRNGNQTAGTKSNAGFPVDLAIISARNVGHWTNVFDRLRGPLRFFATQVNNAESSYNNSLTGFDSNTAIEIGTDSQNLQVNKNSETYVDYLFKRAPGFFDVVAYDGTGANRTQAHNLGVIPEMWWVKRRSSGGESWSCGHKDLGISYRLWLNDSGGGSNNNSYWSNGGSQSATAFPLGTDAAVNGSTHTYIAYLFATLPGISKVGSYTGTGSDINVDCGFTNGARFVLIKRTDSSGNWIIYDTSRGIGSGNDPYLRLNSTQAETTDEDHIDPLSSGFTVTTHSDVNTNGGTYIFLAIA